MKNHRLKIEISDAEMEAYLTIYLREGADSTRENIMSDADLVLKYLEMSGIKHGINIEAIQRLVASEM